MNRMSGSKDTVCETFCTIQGVKKFEFALIMVHKYLVIALISPPFRKILNFKDTSILAYKEILVKFQGAGAMALVTHFCSIIHHMKA